MRRLRVEAGKRTSSAQKGPGHQQPSPFTFSRIRTQLRELKITYVQDHNLTEKHKGGQLESRIR